MTALIGQVAVVTGGNSGIGSSIAFAMAQAGAAVAIAGRDMDRLHSTAERLTATGAQCIEFPCDVADPVSIEKFGDRVLNHFGRVDVVVANAAVPGPNKPLHLISPEEWRACVAVDLDGVFLTFRRFVPAMMDQRSGSLIAISSMTGKRPLVGRTCYGAAKMGVIGLVRALALELGGYGIRVNSICPGFVEGARVAERIAADVQNRGISEEDALRQLTEAAALRRLVRPEEVAAVCVFLATPASASITGEDLNVSAGYVMF
jgi:NAD(P)-dependent dehydrogenase (short-subunit alcohol dehydrogenase family)